MTDEKKKALSDEELEKAVGGFEMNGTLEAGTRGEEFISIGTASANMDNIKSDVPLANITPSSAGKATEQTILENLNDQRIINFAVFNHMGEPKS